MTTAVQVKEELPEIMSAREVAALTGVPISTLCRWARDRDIPTYRRLPGRTGTWLLPREAIDVVRARALAGQR